MPAGWRQGGVQGAGGEGIRGHGSSGSRPASAWANPSASGCYGEIRAALDTPIVNSIWRSLAGRGLLDAAWAVLGPQAVATRPAADGLQDRAVATARQLPWKVAATPAALHRAGLNDARPGMAAVLDAYVVTLPRVLVLVAASTDAG